MESPAVVEIELLEQDRALIQRALEAAGQGPEDGLSWLLEQGLDRFIRDEAEWKALKGQTGPGAEVRRQELKREGVPRVVDPYESAAPPRAGRGT